jgi:hypothetical protein
MRYRHLPLVPEVVLVTLRVVVAVAVAAAYHYC